MPYDPLDPASIEKYGKRLIGGSLNTILGVKQIPDSERSLLVSGRTRGSLGNIVESYYYGIHPKNDGTPDFPEAGVELKTTPVKKGTKGQFSAKERLVLGMIDYVAEAKRDFTTSSYFKKNKKLMLLSYLHQDTKTIGQVKFLLAKLYEFNMLPKEDQKIIREDWEKINNKVKAGLAHELSEGDTLYLAACTKSATSANRRMQMNGVEAKPRAFSYKSSYMTQLFKREVGADEDVERLLTEDELIKNKTFEEIVIGRFTSFIGKTVKDIAKELDIELNPNQKDKFATLARAMMGVKKKKIAEFVAAGVTMKTIQLKADGTPKEAMSFPTFKYMDVINEVWDGDEEDGDARAAFQKQLESRFLFIVYRCADKCEALEERIFEKAFFWTMPQEDLVEAEKVWRTTLGLINTGKIVKNIKINKQNKSIRETYFPSSSSNRVAHVRPHGSNASDTYPLPVNDQLTGEDAYTKHCFWLNISYLKEIKVTDTVKSVRDIKTLRPSPSPYVETFTNIPLYDSVGCGDLTLADPTVQEMHPVPNEFISKGAKYFVLRTSGDSMNKLGINDGDLILCKKNYQAPSGSNAIVLIGDEATLKEIHYEKDGLLLKPKSTNPRHQPTKLVEGDEFKVLGEFVRKLS